MINGIFPKGQYQDTAAKTSLNLIRNSKGGSVTPLEAGLTQKDIETLLNSGGGELSIVDKNFWIKFAVMILICSCVGFFFYLFFSESIKF